MTTLPATHRTAPRLAPLWQLTRAELLRLSRNPMYLLGTLGFPVLWFALFGLPLVSQSVPDVPGATLGPLLLVNFGAAGILSLAMFAFGVQVSYERKGGWLRLLRASPMPAPLYLLSKVISALLFCALSLTLLYLFGYLAGGVVLPPQTALLTLLKLLLGAVPLMLLGMCLGYWANANAATVLANVVSLVMSFGAGLFMPLAMLPPFVGQVAPLLPAYHLGVVGRSALLPTAQEPTSWAALLGFGVVFGILTVWGIRREESREG